MKKEEEKSTMTDIVFEKRNKEYGAYELRKNYYKRLLIALSITFTITLLFILYAVIDYQAPTEDIDAPKIEGVKLQEVDMTHLKPTEEITKRKDRQGVNSNGNLPMDLHGEQGGSQKNSQKPLKPIVSKPVETQPSKPNPSTFNPNQKSTIKPDSAPDSKPSTNSTPNENLGGGNGKGAGDNSGSGNNMGGQSGGSVTVNYASATVKPKFPGCENFIGNALDNCNNSQFKIEFTRNFPKAKIPQNSLSLNVTFIIDSNGTITDVKSQGASASLSEDAVATVKKMWRGRKIIPGKFKEKNASIRCKLPVSFGDIK